jgi:putative oxidoreductase
VHWPADWSSYSQLWGGYAITGDGAGNYKLPLLFVVILMPLLFNGGGKISLDYLLLKITGRDAKTADRIGDGIAAGLMFAILGVTSIFLEPIWGISLMVLALITSVIPALQKKT